jgi:hypothetical protein
LPYGNEQYHYGQQGKGWKMHINSVDWSGVVPGAPVRGVTESEGLGYLFIYFNESFTRDNCGKYNGGMAGGICSKQLNNDDTVIDNNQGAIFAVVITKISQINALDIFLSKNTEITNGNYLADAIFKAKDFDYKIGTGPSKKYVKNFINDIEPIDTTPLCFVSQGGCIKNSGLRFYQSVIKINEFLETKDSLYMINVNSNTPFLPLSLNSDKFNLLSKKYLYTESKGSIKIVSGELINTRNGTNAPTLDLVSYTLFLSSSINKYLFPFPAAGFKFQIQIYQETSYEESAIFPDSFTNVRLEYSP